jgi:hypothetical protein
MSKLEKGRGSSWQSRTLLRRLGTGTRFRLTLGFERWPECKARGTSTGTSRRSVYDAMRWQYL